MLKTWPLPHSLVGAIKSLLLFTMTSLSATITVCIFWRGLGQWILMYFTPLTMGHRMRFWYLSHMQTVNAQTSQRICAVSARPLLLIYAIMEVDEVLRKKETNSPTVPLHIHVPGMT